MRCIPLCVPEEPPRFWQQHLNPQLQSGAKKTVSGCQKRRLTMIPVRWQPRRVDQIASTKHSSENEVAELPEQKSLTAVKPSTAGPMPSSSDSHQVKPSTAGPMPPRPPLVLVGSERAGQPTAPSFMCTLIDSPTDNRIGTQSQRYSVSLQFSDTARNDAQMKGISFAEWLVALEESTRPFSHTLQSPCKQTKDHVAFQSRRHTLGVSPKQVW